MSIAHRVTAVADDIHANTEPVGVHLRQFRYIIGHLTYIGIRLYGIVYIL